VASHRWEEGESCPVIIDVHVHTPRLTMRADSVADLCACFRRMLEAGRRAGIDRQVVLGLWGDNESVRELTASFPDETLGFVSANGADPEAPQTVERHVREYGFRGVKLHQETDLPLTGLLACHPIYRKAAELNVPVLTHTWHQEESLGAVSTEVYGMSLPVSILAELGRRYPETSFIFAHAGGIWEKAFQAVAPYPNLNVDVCGFDPERGVVEKAVAMLGAERVLFGSDAPGRSYAAQVAKVKYADLSEPERQLVLGGNAARLLGLS
jgi:predicted TIM-barrel fold metal-dependent hydrolase